MREVLVLTNLASALIGVLICFRYLTKRFAERERKLDQPNQFDMEGLLILLKKNLCEIGHVNAIDDDVVKAFAEDILRILWMKRT